MRNERGLTLVELLAVLALSSTILILLISVFINGSKAADRSATNQRLQQEANYIVETIRKEYLKPVNSIFELKVDKVNKHLIMDGKIISEGYDYQLFESDLDENDVRVTNEILIKAIKRYATEEFELKIGKGKFSHEVKTTFSKLR